MNDRLQFYGGMVTLWLRTVALASVCAKNLLCGNVSAGHFWNGFFPENPNSNGKAGLSRLIIPWNQARP